MEKILITGGAGFIGSNFIDYILEKDKHLQINNLDALTYAGSLENLKTIADFSRYTFIKGDICDSELVEQILENNQIDTIVHFAAETHVDRSILGPGQFIQTNIIGTYTLLEAARKYWLDKGNSKNNAPNNPRFHHISTDEVYGSLRPDEPAFSETTRYAPNSPYAASKAASDHLVRSYGHTYNLPFTITNCSNNYGPYQFPEKLIPLMITNALEGKPLPMYGDGKQVRDWLFVEDHAEAIYTVLTKSSPGNTYNIGGNNQPTNLEIVETICEILDEMLPDSKYKPHKNLIQFVKDRPGHDRRYAMDISRINHELGWQPKHSLSSGLRKTVEWYLSHKDWLDKIRKQKSYQSWVTENYITQRETKKVKKS
jgi:dTDP-glucose 4,6-dehydratase